MNKNAIIIGATSGIGRALAEEMAADGWTVGITGRRAEELERMCRNRPDRFVAAAFDITAPDATVCLGQLIDRMGGIDLLILSSGTGELNPTLDYGLEKITNDLNVCAFTEIIVYAYDYFSKRGGGSIAAITSVAGLRGDNVAPSYSASKAYQINFLEGLRKRSAKSGENITITDLRPGSVDTAMMKGEGHFWISTPERAAKTIYRAIRKKKAVQYVTPRWRIVAWLFRNMPAKIYKSLF